MGQFYYACKAFDVLERLDPDPELLALGFEVFGFWGLGFRV